MNYETIRERARCKAEAREVPDLGTQYFKRLSLRDRDIISVSLLGPDGKPNAHGMVGHRARMVALCWVDADGKPITNEAEVGSWLPEIVTPLYEAAMAVNALEDNAVEDAAKN